jgi:hypothetical protein
VKPDGAFAFIDYFYNAKYFGSKADFESLLRELNLAHFDYKSLQSLIHIHPS